jgi:hypothetical protein
MNDTMKEMIDSVGEWRKSVDGRLPLNREPDTTTDAEEAGLQSDDTAQCDDTVSAHKLLDKWPIPSEWYQDIPFLHKLAQENRAVSEYVIRLERDRESLVPLDVGDDLGSDNHTQGLDKPESSNQSGLSSPAIKREDSWNFPPSHNVGAEWRYWNMPRKQLEYHGGQGQDGRLDVRCVVMDELLVSFHRNIHRLHPFLDLTELQNMFQEFTENYDAPTGHGNLASPANYQLKSGKRRRPDGTSGLPYPGGGKIKCSLHHAIVLLVLALGKVCSYQQTVALPSPHSPANAISESYGSTSHPYGSFNSGTFGESGSSNVDTLPGMAYYTQAVAILGSHHGGQTIAHAQAFILAALYMSQYARVLESWSWAHHACQVTTVLIKQ